MSSISGGASRSSEVIIKDMQPFFQKINNNYWGIANGKWACPLGCLNCNEVMYDFKDFQKYGPEIGKNTMFCIKHACEFSKLFLELENAADKEHKKIDELYREASKLFQQKKEKLLKEIDISREWVFLGNS